MSVQNLLDEGSETVAGFYIFRGLLKTYNSNQKQRVFDKRLYVASIAQNIYFLILRKKSLPTSALVDSNAFRKNLKFIMAYR